MGNGKLETTDSGKTMSARKKSPVPKILFSNALDTTNRHPLTDNNTHDREQLREHKASAVPVAALLAVVEAIEAEDVVVKPHIR